MASANKSIYGALIANLAIAVTKFIAGGISNCSSMTAEGIHSMVDTTNQVLLLYGIRKSKKPADRSHPFGYGKELYFWSFMVSILIFGLGGGISINQGIRHIIDPEPLSDPTINYIVLAVSLLFEGTSLFIAIKEFDKLRNGEGWWASIIRSKDPSSFLVLFEDSAAVLGLLIVLVCLIVEHSFNIPELDGVATLMVGVILVGVSLILARESRSLLMGEGIAPSTQEEIKKIALTDPGINRVLNLLSTYQSPNEVVLMLMVEFKPDLDTDDILKVIEDIKMNIRKKFPLIRFIMIQPVTEN
ncbi:MAG TPA: cation diffusion facilitator family transporter [Flavitalea sp.]|nr:cation diffusion facilitator family transporter [Flavitalea sp.]